MKNTKKEEDGCPFLGDFMATAGGDLELVKQHVLLFVCALIPKAMASTLAFFLHTSPSWLRERKVNRCGHSHVLLIRQVLCKHWSNKKLGKPEKEKLNQNQNKKSKYLPNQWPPGQEITFLAPFFHKLNSSIQNDAN